ncbi:uncharacterized protein LOC119245122 [Talpa occidentalis]|uniref:uncharacterized protein LOC119245122 n=1 Tax=Talpa occidentalis TaxID=50954 RepID=UPI001890B326|nr:uncharacterized protein LOC119245122 [Talpa occidentalis]
MARGRGGASGGRAGPGRQVRGAARGRLGCGAAALGAFPAGPGRRVPRRSCRRPLSLGAGWAGGTEGVRRRCSPAAGGASAGPCGRSSWCPHQCDHNEGHRVAAEAEAGAEPELSGRQVTPHALLILSAAGGLLLSQASRPEASAGDPGGCGWRLLGRAGYLDPVQRPLFRDASPRSRQRGLSKGAFGEIALFYDSSWLPFRETKHNGFPGVPSHHRFRPGLCKLPD